MFNQSQVAEVQTAIDRALARAVRKYPVLRGSAEDMAQDAWVKVLAGYDATTGNAPGAYAYTVATTISIDYARNRGAKVRAHDASMSADAPLTSGDEVITTLVDTLASTLADAPTMMHAKVRANAVQAALATLSDAHRAALAAWLDDATMTGSQRIAKMRALDALREEISASL